MMIPRGAPIHVILLFLLSYSVSSQEILDTITPNKGTVLTPSEYRNSIFYLIQESWIANTPPSAASILANYTPSVGERRVPLREGEGEGTDHFFLEAKFLLIYPLVFGRKEVGSGMRKLNRINFDYGTNFRITYDQSKPLTPADHKVGFSWNINMWNNYSGAITNSFATSSRESKYQLDSSKNLHFINLLLQVHHYSNGQSGESTYTDPLGQTRNNYINGDFSTNYYYFELTLGRYRLPGLGLHQLSVGARFDWGIEDTFLAFNTFQEKSYGKQRLALNYDYRAGPGHFWPLHIRLETGYILDNVDNFVPNLQNQSEEYRFNGRILVEISPKYNRALGYFITGYYGRDYLNIRYDDIIYSLNAGFTLNLDNYTVNKYSPKY